MNICEQGQRFGLLQSSARHSWNGSYWSMTVPNPTVAYRPVPLIPQTITKALGMAGVRSEPAIPGLTQKRQFCPRSGGLVRLESLMNERKVSRRRFERLNVGYGGDCSQANEGVSERPASQLFIRKQLDRMRRHSARSESGRGEVWLSPVWLHPVVEFGAVFVPAAEAVVGWSWMRDWSVK